MPIYEYECTSCHHHFDLIQKINDEPVKICPECSRETVVKLVSAAGFQLKGTGWYATDFKDKGKPAEKGSTSNNSPDKATPDAKSSDTSASTTTSSATETGKAKEAPVNTATSSKGDA